ncbi:hypothetical protein AC578_1249 [Pseudocercospora eumusae]|uniref:Uncharacterized protein n=1 Tax=Pseudocercospora eumusae TaxID=321146 RepID=A0A139H885_9PEZI|nr:hypothetical protein AC578_1249 [Pseudocercospora eumusae]
MVKTVKHFPLRGVDSALHIQRSCYIALWHIDQAKHNSGSTKYSFDPRHCVDTLENLIKAYKLSYRSLETNQVSALSGAKLLQHLQSISSSKTSRRGSGFAGVIATGTNDMQPDYLERIKQSTQYLAMTDSLPVPGQSAEPSGDHTGEIVHSRASKQQSQMASSQHGVSGKLPRKRKASNEFVSPPSKRGGMLGEPEVVKSFSTTTRAGAEDSDVGGGPAETLIPPPLAIKPSRQRSGIRQLDSDGHDTAVIGRQLSEAPSGEENEEIKQKLDANEINDALSRISHEILENTESVLAFLGLHQKRMIDSPCVRKPSENLSRLYETCWGREWFNIENQMEPHEGLSASNVIRALIACHVHCFIFEDGSPWQIELCSNFDMTSLAGAQEIFFALASENDSERLEAMSQMLNLYTQALKSAVQENQTFHNRFDAHAAASRLVETLQPHIQNLVNLATALQKFQGEGDGWRADFTNGMESILCSASELKCRLIHSNYKHEFFWPLSGSSVDTAFMKLAHKVPGYGSKEVAFTLFPGIHVDFGLSRGLWPVRTADVVARLRANDVDEDIMINNVYCKTWAFASMKALSKIRHHLGHHDEFTAECGNDPSDPLPDVSTRLVNYGGEVAEQSKVDRLKSKAKTVQHAIQHPRRAIKQHPQKKFADQFVLNEQPWLADQSKANFELFEAYDALESAETAVNQQPRDPDLKHHVEVAERLVVGLEEKREAMEVSWHLSRYVHRARVVRRDVEFPDRNDPQYFYSDGTSTKPRFLWIKWLGHLALYGFQEAVAAYIEPTNTTSYSRQELIRSIERLLVASQSLQYWWNRVRYVYRWEDPWLTSKWLILYLVLLKTGYFMTFYYSYLLWSYLSNWDGKHTRNWMKQSTERSTQTHGRAVMLSELVLRHGTDAWFEPLMEEMGPWLQEQFLDLAQFLEISNNYYMWRNRRSGIYTSVTYFALMLICGLPSLEFSIKVFWLSCGLFFFMSRPISSLYPRFRHVVDPVRWMYWNHPTQSEFCFAWLRSRIQASWRVDRSNGTSTTGIEDEDDDGDDDDESMFFDCLANIDQDQPSNSDDEVAISWPAHCKEHRGRLELVNNMQTLRFVSRGGIGVTTIWKQAISHLLELQKLTLPLTDLPAKPSVTKLSKSSAALRIIWAGPTRRQEPGEDDGDASGLVEEVLYAMNLDDRDNVFNNVIGISDFAWQEVQPEIRSGENRTFFR